MGTSLVLLPVVDLSSPDKISTAQLIRQVLFQLITMIRLVPVPVASTGFTFVNLSVAILVCVMICYSKLIKKLLCLLDMSRTWILLCQEPWHLGRFDGRSFQGEQRVL